MLLIYSIIMGCKKVYFWVFLILIIANIYFFYLNLPKLIIPGILPGPRINIDHWHAQYEITLCGKNYTLPSLKGKNIHIHDDTQNVIVRPENTVHIHPESK